MKCPECGQLQIVESVCPQCREAARQRAKRQFTSNHARQQPLLAGLDCLPGQCDLFQTDGELKHDDDR